MIYTARNSIAARVYDVDTKQELKQVVQIDDEAGVVVVAHDPIRVNAAGNEVDTFEAKYRAIHAIRGVDPLPCLFHCYGRVQ